MIAGRKGTAHSSRSKGNLDPVKNSLKSWLGVPGKMTPASLSSLKSWLGVPGKMTPVSLSLPKDLDYDSWLVFNG